MNDDIFNSLNEIYKPLCDTAWKVKDKLAESGFCVKSGFYNSHYVKSADGFAMEFFPIPVISIENVGDIGVDIDSIWLEIVLPREKAILIDYPDMEQKYTFEVYGAENYLCDFYNAQSDARLVAEKIKNSEETHICMSFECPQDGDVNELIHIIRVLTK